MIKYILEYKNKDFYHNRRIFIETYMRCVDDKILVELSDFTCKDGAIEKDWFPLWLTGEEGYQCSIGINTDTTMKKLFNNNNPKYKLYTKEEFDNIFNIKEEITL